MTDEEKLKLEEMKNKLKEVLPNMIDFNELSEEELSVWSNDLLTLYKLNLDIRKGE